MIKYLVEDINKGMEYCNIPWPNEMSISETTQWAINNIHKLQVRTIL